MNEIVFHIESYNFDYEFYYGKYFQKIGLFWIFGEFDPTILIPKMITEHFEKSWVKLCTT